MPNPAPAAAPAATAADPKQTASNIANSINNKLNGKAPAAQPPINDQKPPADPVSDPNAGKDKYVVEGREVWLTPEQARSYVQKGLAFDRTSDQLGRLQQEQATFMRALITDPGTVLANISKAHNVPMHDLVQKVLKGNSSDEVKEAIGKWYYENAVEPLKLSPEQLKAREDAKWRADKEAQEKNTAAQSIRQENFAKFQKAMSEIKANISEAMKDSGLPNNDSELGSEMARMVAEQMRVAYFQKRAITPKQAIEFVKKKIRAVNSAYYETLEGQDLVAALGDIVTERVKKHYLKIAQDQGGQPPAVQKGPRAASRNREREVITQDDMHDYLEKRKREG